MGSGALPSPYRAPTAYDGTLGRPTAQAARAFLAARSYSPDFNIKYLCYYCKYRKMVSDFFVRLNLLYHLTRVVKGALGHPVYNVRVKY